jgi:DNA repair exonuclease SbcCD ATPase subunit
MEKTKDKMNKYKNPYIKVTWQDTHENFTPEKISRIKSYFQKKYDTKYVQIITKVISNEDNTKLQSLDISENISDLQYQKILMKDFVEENKIEVSLDRLNNLDNKVNEEFIKNNGDKVKFSKWYVKKVEFSNFLSYGRDNEIDFTVLPGITVVESTPKNFGGKSTATVDLLLFLFFNKTTKTKTNSEIFNRFSDDDEVKVKGYITIDNEDYIIERVSTRKKTKSGDYNVTNRLEFYKIKDDGGIDNLTGEQRRETEEFISRAIGTEEDFLSTILTTGYNLEELIESKPTARGLILTRFLGLEILKEKEEICKTIQSEWSKKLISNNHNTNDLETEIESFNENIKSNQEDIVKLEQESKKNQDNLINLESNRENLLKKRNNDVDQELIRTNVDQIKTDINVLNKQKESSLTNANLVEVKEPTQYYSEDEHQLVKDEINGLIVEGRVNADTITRNETLIKELEDGQICPTCKRSLEDVDHTEEINRIKELIESTKKIQIENRKKYDELNEKEKVFSNLKKEFDEYEKNKLKKTKYELEVEQKRMDIEKLQMKLDNYDRNKQKLEENKNIDIELISIKTQIESANSYITQCTKNIEKLKSNNNVLLEKIETNKELIRKIKIENETQSIFKIYLTIFGKNGISKVILKNMVPLINQELYRLLVDSCHFILELNINEKNEVDFLMIDTETRIVKPLSSGSGYERTISSLALRSVLTKISSLPKPNIVVMDEVFGKIADENLEMVGEFFKKIKDYFEHIFVISHNPLIRNWSDNLIMVKKEENISSIDFITPKIS